MTVTSGHLDSLMNGLFGPQSLTALSLESGSAANGSIISVTARTGMAPYATEDNMAVTSFDDSNNTIVLTGAYTSSGGYYGGGGTTYVPWVFTVVGVSGHYLLLAAADGAAATKALPAATVANDIQNGQAAALSGNLFVLDVTNGTIASGQDLTFTPLVPASETVAMALAATSASPVPVIDSAAAVQANLDALQSLSAAGKIGAITFTDGGTPVLTLSAAQLGADQGVLGKIGGNFSLTVTGATAASAGSAATAAHVTMTDVSDTAANLLSNIDALNGLVAGGHALSITLTDAGVPTLSLTAAQLAADTAVLKDVGTDFTLAVDGSTANITVAGIAGRGTVVQFTGTAAHYTVTPSGDGTSFTVTDSGTGRASVDHLSGITALQFSDGTDFVAQAPGTTSITTGNVTELYSAVLARTPDVAGLAYYQAQISSTPGLSLNQLAQNFLSAPEYVNNPAHNYAQTAAGDGVFITDTYTNLLHRAPEAGAVGYYQNVIAQFTAGLTPGTSAFTAAELAGHAQVLVNFAASAEFLANVQITAQHPADAQHFLYLI